jgi:hypothetical protein
MRKGINSTHINGMRKKYQDRIDKLQEELDNMQADYALLSNDYDERECDIHNTKELYRMNTLVMVLMTLMLQHCGNDLYSMEIEQAIKKYFTAVAKSASHMQNNDITDNVYEDDAEDGEDEF